MAKFAPFELTYKTVARLNNYADGFLYLSTCISVAITILGYLDRYPVLKSILIGTNILFICMYVFLDNRANYIFTKVEMKRRLDWLDNSFGTNFSGKRSIEYFTNDHISPGMYKLAVNCFENSYHTQFIINKMLPEIIFKTCFIVLVFVCSAYFGNREFVRMFFDLSLPAILIQKLIKVLFFSIRMADVLDRFKLLFNNLMQSGFEKKEPEALRDILEYETALSWASTPLDSSIFNKNMDTLAKDWEEMKLQYQIKTL
ncbi:MAG TPA: hypothetical protein VK588_05545 [Chitinophagaceae bacterium]|nr:hypothetical protein [Chitinophagaceae bacterium]